MTDPQEKDIPTLEDELFALADDEQADDEQADDEQAEGGGRAEPIIRMPASPPWERFARLDRRDIRRAVAGFVAFTFVDLMMMYAPLMGRDRSSVLPQFVALLAFAFGLGSLFVWHVRGAFRPFGIGMMLGWVALTLLSAGFLTGVMR